MPDKDKRDAVDKVDQRVVYVVPQEERSRRRDRRDRDRRQGGLGCLGTARLLMLMPILVIVLVVGCMMLVMLFEFADFMRDPLDNFLGIFGFDPDAEPEIKSTVTIIQEIRELSELDLYESTIDVKLTVVDTGAQPDAELDVTYKSSVVKAGIDLSLINEDAVVVGDDNQLTVTLPPVYLTSCDLGQPDYDASCFDIIFVQDCNSIVDDLQDAAYVRGINALRETAYEMDLQALAEAEAENVVRDLLDTLGYEDVEFLHSLEEHPDDDTCFAE